MNEIKRGHSIRIPKVITEDLQHAVARTFGKAVVELTRQEYYNFILECVHARVQDMKNDATGFITREHVPTYREKVDNQKKEGKQ